MKVRIAPAEGEPFELELDDGSMVVGRSSTAHLPLADPYASRHHSRLTVRGESLLVEDLGSLGLTLAAFVVPVLAALAVVALVVLILVAWRRRRRRVSQ